MRSLAQILVVATAMIGVACSSQYQGTVSECGGFDAKGNTHALTDAAAPAYCDAEVIEWEYDATAKTLQLTNARVFLNCCGDHSVALEQVGDHAYTISEVDAPERGARCGCMCVYDFKVTGEAVEAGTVTLTLNREITDNEDEPSRQVWQGELDTAEGSGRIVVDETDLGSWCDESATS